ncbi:MAG: apolipoprotein N-acyltransferase [Pelagibacteraceae bacterium]
MFLNFLNSRFFLVFFFPFLLGASTVFSFQPFNFNFINFLVIPILFLITYYVQKKSRNTFRKKPYLLNLFFIGYFFGIGFFFTGVYWISHSLTFDESFKFLIPVSIIGLPIFLGIFFGVGNLLVGPFLSRNFLSVILFSGSLAFIDILRAKLFTGFPWNIWAYSWSWVPELLQGLSVINFFTFNFFVILFYASPLLIIFKKKYFKIFALFILIFFGNFIYGSSVIKKNNELVSNYDESKLFYIKSVSPNLDLKYNLTETEIENNIKNLIRYSEPEENKKTLFVWPEGAFSGYSYDQIRQYGGLFQNSFSDNHLILLGVNTEEESNNEFKVYNSIVIVNKNFDIIYQYNKFKLVPFGEFIPFENFINFLGLKKITQGQGSFSKGEINQLFTNEDLKLLPLICYEIIFPEIVKENKLSNLIINISQDAWFGDSIGPYQHFSKAIFRAIENNSFLVRSANKGITAIIDNKGVVKKTLQPFEKGSIEFNVQLINTKKFDKKIDLIFLIILFTGVLVFSIYKKNEK